MKTQIVPPSSGAIVPVKERGVTAEAGFGIERLERKAETSITAAAAQAKAEVEAAYIVALNRPRNIMAVREKVLDACRRPQFAEDALYRKPVGKTFIEDLSIRFAEEALRAFGNVRVSSPTIYEDAEIRVVRITVTDLEANLGYSDEVTLQKTVERREPRAGQEILGERKNSTGQTVYIIRATEDDFIVKLNAAKSKVIRNSGLRLIPSDVKEEARALIVETRAKGGSDPNADRKKIADSFRTLNINVKELERYLGHDLDLTTPAEINELRGLYGALRDGETNWGAVMEARNAERGGKAPVPPPAGKAPPASQAEAFPERADDLREEIVTLHADLMEKTDDATAGDEAFIQSGLTEKQMNTCEDVAVLAKLRDALKSALAKAKK
jgi:hypothetical protein